MVYFNQLDQASALVVIDHELQRYKIASNPTEGRAWGARTFHIDLGRPLTEAVYRQVKALIPSAKIGHKQSTEDYSVIVSLKMKDFDFGVIDVGGAEYKMVFGLIGAALASGDDAVSHAKITISTEIRALGKNPKYVEVIGEGVHTTGFYSANEKALEKAVENAIADFAKNLTLLIEKELAK